MDWRRTLHHVIAIPLSQRGNNNGWTGTTHAIQSNSDFQVWWLNSNGPSMHHTSPACLFCHQLLLLQAVSNREIDTTATVNFRILPAKIKQRLARRLHKSKRSIHNGDAAQHSSRYSPPSSATPPERRPPGSYHDLVRHIIWWKTNSLCLGLLLMAGRQALSSL